MFRENIRMLLSSPTRNESPKTQQLLGTARLLEGNAVKNFRMKDKALWLLLNLLIIISIQVT